MGGRQLPHARPLQHRLTLCPPRRSRTAVIRAVPWRPWRARLEADGGGLENRYGAEASSWVRIPRPPLSGELSRDRDAGVTRRGHRRVARVASGPPCDVVRRTAGAGEEGCYR